MSDGAETIRVDLCIPSAERIQAEQLLQLTLQKCEVRPSVAFWALLHLAARMSIRSGELPGDMFSTLARLSFAQVVEEERAAAEPTPPPLRSVQ